LDIEKMESGNLVLKIRPTPVDRIVEGSLELVSGFAEQQGVRLESVDLPQVEAAVDEDRIVQVLQNLLVNAVKFSPEGKAVTLAVVPAVGPGGAGMLRFSVKDRGPGIKPEELGSLFERFIQLEGADGKRRGGTGLGLAICKEIVKKHGGRVGVESTPGKGSEFWFEVPVSQPG
ncbi:MAG TPA: ATP-binding protein, partial [Candidatus Obscuribacter sp.]|nr:ATP-binding protein [Candidatus Obscuribacter sp.]